MCYNKTSNDIDSYDHIRAQTCKADLQPEAFELMSKSGTKSNCQTQLYILFKSDVQTAIYFADNQTVKWIISNNYAQILNIYHEGFLGL